MWDCWAFGWLIWTAIAVPCRCCPLPWSLESSMRFPGWWLGASTLVQRCRGVRVPQCSRAAVQRAQRGQSRVAEPVLQCGWLGRLSGQPRQRWHREGSAADGAALSPPLWSRGELTVLTSDLQCAIYSLGLQALNGIWVLFSNCLHYYFSKSC